MKLATEHCDIQDIIIGPIDYRYLLQILEQLCIYSIGKGDDLIPDTLKVIRLLCSLDNPSHKDFVIKAINHFSEQGLRLGEKGHKLLTFAGGINACFVILESVR